jgi:hypothetical protein
LLWNSGVEQLSDVSSTPGMERLPDLNGLWINIHSLIIDISAPNAIKNKEKKKKCCSKTRVFMT